MDLSASLREYALRLLGRRAYSVARLREKLQRRCRPEPAAEVIDAVLERLVALRLLDDMDYCRRFVEERCRFKPRGRWMLDRELRERGVSAATVKTFWAGDGAVAVDELVLARRLADQKRPRLEQRYAGRELRDRLGRFLASRGMGPAVIRTVLNEASRTCDEDKRGNGA